MAQTPSQCDLSLHADASFMAQSDRVLVLDPTRTIARRRVFHLRRPAEGTLDAFIKTYNKTAEPFAWTKSKVYQRRVKGRRLSDL